VPQYSIVGDAIALRNSPFQSETLVKGRSIGEAIGLLTNYVVDTPPSIAAVNTPPLALWWRWLIISRSLNFLHSIEVRQPNWLGLVR